ncbi:PIN domain-containing protein [Frankia torreyi]|uniref:PIN domain-containing protein n=1 Tax=Frankia torreyi TaxID=1856 RepID=A0A0D8BE52_9ACTN|nr:MULTISPECIES: type II toxin-antitoxin system VapC family toxin [Frankia]KJE22320.1 PIN domain-containing protein [Frankia torreyi]KQC37960.1 twitching motility protein PilT [Frankia sp. ACN1ag]KQM05116.1 PIN domain-containing protein [Frankia sp. CpI1-P]
MPTRIYLDTSALAKMFIAEKESGDLRQWLVEQEPPLRLVSSALLAVELTRLLRLVNPAMLDLAESFLSSDVDLMQITPPLLADAARIPPARLRTLDAIHLATALELRDSLDVVLSYDKLFIEAVSASGLTLASPGSGT